MLSNSALNGENVGITAPSNDIDKKRCPRCHANLPNDSMFCQFCGTRLSASEPVSPNSLATDIQKERNAAILKRIETQKAADKRNKIIKIIARSVAIVLVTIGIISYAISDAKKSSYNNELRNFAAETMSDDYTNVYADVTLMRPEYYNFFLQNTNCTKCGKRPCWNKNEKFLPLVSLCMVLALISGIVAFTAMTSVAAWLVLLASVGVIAWYLLREAVYTNMIPTYACNWLAKC